VHFDSLSLFSYVHAEKVGNPKKRKCERADFYQNESHEIEPNPSTERAMHEGDIILHFEMNL
jgi:hypothetical protein